MSVKGLLGRKVGMTQVFDRKGEVHPVTVIEAGPCTVVQVKKPETDGYGAVQLGFGAVKRVNRPMKGHFKGLGEFRYLREFPVEDSGQWQVGQRVGAELFSPGDFVDVTGISKGRGFAGGVRRYGFRGGPRTHGQSDRTRAPGSIGPGTSPGRVRKGLHMAGHLGSDRVTVRNLLVLESDASRGILLVEGSVPGAKNGVLRIRRSGKSPREIVGVAGIVPAAAPAEEPPAPEEAPVEEPAAEVVDEVVEEPVAEPEALAEEPAEAPGDDSESSDQD